MAGVPGECRPAPTAKGAFVDAETRALERCEPGSPRHLVMRMRAGTLERRWVECAAFLGDEAARAVTDWPPPWVEALGMGRGEFVVREIDRDLPTLLRALDDERWTVVREVPCEGPLSTCVRHAPVAPGSCCRVGYLHPCAECGDESGSHPTGKRDVPIPMILRAALAAARACHGKTCAWPMGRGGLCPAWGRPRRLRGVDSGANGGARA